MGEDQNACLVGCAVCGATVNIYLLPHRKNGRVIGVLHLCQFHVQVAADTEIEVLFKKKEE